jgi:deazaflavin-dependent oxidoreductase (nitroreductase family)
VPLPRALARFNRVVTNPVQRVWAGRLRGFVIVEHVGRKSGRRYRTPVNVRREPEGFAIALTYGAETDWVRNVVAAGGGHVVYRGERIEVTGPTLETGPNVLAGWPAVARLVLRRLGVDEVMHLTALESQAASARRRKLKM